MTTALSNYTEAIKNLPDEAFLGSLLYFSISQADVNLTQARADLTAAGLSVSGLRKNLRPIDAFRKATNKMKKKFAEDPARKGIRSELMVRPVGEDGAQSYRHLILERTMVQEGKKRRLYYDKVGDITFTRGVKKDGEYSGHSVESRRTGGHLAEPLNKEEDAWITERLANFEDDYDHMLNYMDSHAVRTFVRESIYNLSGICVKGSGGLYFVAHQHDATIAKLGTWVKSVGSEFHALPLLNLVEQRDMILEAFEDETVEEVERLMSEVAKILTDPNRQIEEKTFDAYALRAAEMAGKIKEYSNMLGTRAERAQAEVSIYSQQVMALAPRIKENKKVT